MQLQDYFDQLAPDWDREVTPERLECLRNIIKELDIKPGSHLLDIGSGTGILLPFLVEVVGGQGRIIALDVSAKMLHEARPKAAGLQPIADFAQADATAIPLPRNCIDLAICNSVFPHFRNKAKALKEIARVLKANGQLVICHTASRDAINQLHQSIGGTVGADLLPDETELRELIRQVGLAVTRLEDNPKRYLVIASKAIRPPD